MVRHFTLADLLMWVTLIALLLAIVVPLWRHSHRVRYYADEVIEVSASADGSTFGALLGDGRVLVWDSEGNLKTTLQTLGTFGGRLALSFDGRLAVVSPGDAKSYVNVEPHGTVEIWDIADQKVQKRLPMPEAAPLFSTSDNSLLISNFATQRHELHPDDRAASPRILPGGAGGFAFSPDGKSVAIGSIKKGLQIWDVATLCKQRELVSGGHTKRFYRFVAWSPSGESIAALAWEFDKAGNTVEYIERWELSTGQVRRIFPQVPNGNDLLQLRYLPDGHRLFFVTRKSPASGPRGDGATTQVFDAETLEPAAAIGMSDVGEIAGSMRGDKFITAGQYTVELRDTTTLQPLRRLYEGPSPPNVWPAVCGVALWGIVFTVRSVRNLKRRQPALL